MRKTRRLLPQSPTLPMVVPRREGIDVDGVVDHLNKLYTRKGLELALAVGRYVFEHVFGGDPDRVRSRGKADPSFQEVAAHPELLMSRTWLWRSVAVVLQWEQLPAGVAQRLPWTHHTLLLPVAEPIKVALAERAAEEGWTTRRLKAEIDALDPSEPATAGTLTVRRAERAARGLESVLEGLTPSAMTPEERRALVQVLGRLSWMIGEVRQVLDVDEE